MGSRVSVSSTDGLDFGHHRSQVEDESEWSEADVAVDMSQKQLFKEGDDFGFLALGVFSVLLALIPSGNPAVWLWLTL